MKNLFVALLLTTFLTAPSFASDEYVAGLLMSLSSHTDAPEEDAPMMPAVVDENLQMRLTKLGYNIDFDPETSDSISFENLALDSEHLASLIQAFSDYPIELKVLYLNDNQNIKNAGIKILAEAIKDGVFPGLTGLYLDNIGISCIGAKILAGVLPESQVINLYLKNNFIKSNGRDAIKNAGFTALTPSDKREVAVFTRIGHEMPAKTNKRKRSQ